MKQTAKRLLCLALAFLLCLSLLPAARADEAVSNATSGTCGKKLTWTLDDERNLTISGTGEMLDYEYNGDWAPWGTGIRSVMIEEGVTSIGDLAFYYCESLTSVTIPSSVTSIGSWAFSGCSSLTSMTIPSSVTSIGGSAFSDCSSLTSVTIPPSVTSIGNEAFSGCSSLTSVTISKGVVSIAYEAFSHCVSLTSVTIPPTVTTIGVRAFSNCSALTSVMIEEGVTSIGSYAFWDCSALTNVTIPPSVTTIEDGVFNGCSSLMSVTIPEGVTSIGRHAFRDCSSLTSVAIPEGVTSIEWDAFWGCSSLTSVTIPSSVTSIGEQVFSCCSSLTAIYVNEDNPSYKSVDGVLFTKDNERLLCFPGGRSGSYFIPSGVTSIGEFAFGDCKGLTYVEIPEGVTRIDRGAFLRCSKLNSIRLPITLVHIKSSLNVEGEADCPGAFEDCNSLTDVYYAGTQKQWEKIVIEWGNNDLLNATIHFESSGYSAAPKLTGSNNAKGKPMLSWNGVAGSAKYQVYRSATGKAGSFKLLKTTTALKYTNSKAALGKTFYYKVRGVTEDGTKGDFSEVVKLGVTTAAPTLSGELNAKGKPALSWKSVKGAAKYEVYRSTTGKDGSFKRLKTVEKLSYTNSKAAAGKTYYYKVRTVTASGLKSPFSNIIKLTAKPGTPTLTGKLSSKGKPLLSWESAKGAAKYQVYRSTTGKSGSFKRIATVTELKYTDTAAKAGKTYYYKVRAMASDGTKGKYSEVVKLKAAEAKTPVIKTQPKNVTAAKGETAVFKVKATGVDLSYQWQYRKSASGSWKNATAEGNWTATLKVPVTAKKNGWQYRCVITNSAGKVTTKAVTLTVG